MLKKQTPNLMVEIVADLHTTFYGTREFYFRDCNGYILSFSEAGD